MANAENQPWALVTGASRGLGHAIAVRLASEGFGIVVGYHEREDAARVTLGEVEEAGSPGQLFKVDLADAETSEPALDAVTAEHRIDVLVNCAGITVDRTIAKLSDADWTSVIETNLSSAFRATRAVLPSMRERRYGRIVNISSIIGQMGNFGQTNYAASKAGMIGFTKALAMETARHDITANAICPGFIETDMLKAVPEPARDALLARIPKGRFGQPEEIARAVSFLVAPDAGFITGAVLNVNGGMYV